MVALTRQNGLAAASRPFAASLPHGEGLQFKLHNEGRALSDDIAAASRGSSHHAGGGGSKKAFSQPMTWATLGEREPDVAWRQQRASHSTYPFDLLADAEKDAKTLDSDLLMGGTVDMGLQVDALFERWKAMYGSIRSGFLVMDTGGTGFASFTDFRAILLRLEFASADVGGSSSHARRLFNYLDVDGDSMLSLQDVRTAFVTARGAHAIGATFALSEAQHGPAWADVEFPFLQAPASVMTECDQPCMPAREAGPILLDAARPNIDEAALVPEAQCKARGSIDLSVRQSSHAWQDPPIYSNLGSPSDMLDAFHNDPRLIELGARLEKRCGGMLEGLGQMDVGNTGFLSRAEFVRETLRAGLCDSSIEADRCFTALSGGIQTTSWQRSDLIPVILQHAQGDSQAHAPSQGPQRLQDAPPPLIARPAALQADDLQAVAHQALGNGTLSRTQRASVMSALADAQASLSAAGGVLVLQPPEPRASQVSQPKEQRVQIDEVVEERIEVAASSGSSKEKTGRSSSSSSSSGSSAGWFRARTSGTKKAERPVARKQADMEAKRRLNEARHSMAGDIAANMGSQAARARLERRRQKRGGPSGTSVDSEHVQKQRVSFYGELPALVGADKDRSSAALAPTSLDLSVSAHAAGGGEKATTTAAGGAGEQIAATGGEAVGGEGRDGGAGGAGGERAQRGRGAAPEAGGAGRDAPKASAAEKRGSGEVGTRPAVLAMLDPPPPPRPPPATPAVPAPSSQAQHDRSSSSSNSSTHIAHNENGRSEIYAKDHPIELRLQTPPRGGAQRTSRGQLEEHWTQRAPPGKAHHSPSTSSISSSTVGSHHFSLAGPQPLGHRHHDHHHDHHRHSQGSEASSTDSEKRHNVDAWHRWLVGAGKVRQVNALHAAAS